MNIDLALDPVHPVSQLRGLAQCTTDLYEGAHAGAFADRRAEPNLKSQFVTSSCRVDPGLDPGDDTTWWARRCHRHRLASLTVS